MFVGQEDSFSHGQVIKCVMNSYHQADDNDTQTISWWSASKPRLNNYNANGVFCFKATITVLKPLHMLNVQTLKS